MNTIATLLREEDILLDLDVSNQSALFEEIARHCARQYGLARELVVKALEGRESRGSTVLDAGVAIPHGQLSGVAAPLLVYVRLKPALPCGQQNQDPVTDVVALLLPQSAGVEPLLLLAEVAHSLADQDFRGRLQACSDARQVMRVWSECDEGIWV